MDTKQRIEQLKQSVSKEQFPHLGGSRTYYTERRTEPLMLPSKISGLSRLYAVAKVDNFVVRFSFPYIAPLKIHPGFVPRDSAPQSNAEVSNSKAPLQSDTSQAQELKPERAKKIAAGQEPFFE